MSTRLKNKLQSMIMQFRVAELQILLEFVGESTTRLRKKELQMKACKLISKKYNLLISQKIRSIFKNMTEDVSDEDYFPSDLDDFSGDDFDDGNLPVNYHNNALTRAENNKFFSMFKNNLDLKLINQVRFANISLYDYKSNILILSPLVPKKQEGECFLFNIKFTLDHETLNALFSEGSRYHAILRFCVLNDEVEVTDHLPPWLSVQVNHYDCYPPEPVALLGSKHNPMKKPEPIDITSYLQTNKYVNSLSVQWLIDYYTLYGVVIQLLCKLTADELIVKLKEKGERDPNISEKLILDRLNDEDNEIAATSLNMSLTCPLGKMLMSLPSRATTCNHLQCFDGYFYIKMNEIKSTWRCPICYQSCLYDDLFIDGFFMNILRSERLLPSIRIVQLHSDGSWEPVMKDEKTAKRTMHEPVEVTEVPEKFVKHEEPSNSSPESFNLKSNTLFEDLTNFLLTYDNPNMNSIQSQMSSSSMYPLYNRFNSVNHHNREKSSAAEKNIMVVDLTLSDSETEAAESIASESSISTIDVENDSQQCIQYNSSSSTSVCSMSSTPPRPTISQIIRSASPPMYDIDSDSSF